MQKHLRLTVTILTVLLVGAAPNVAAFAQTKPPSASESVVLPEPVVRALQEALNKQGIPVKVDGVLNDETRAGVRKYQSQHHLPVTGEADKATLDKLGVRQSAAPTQSPVLAQAVPTSPSVSPSAPVQTPTSPTQSGQMPSGMMMDCPMMQGQMQSMMQMMQGMMQMMKMMQAQMPSGQTQPGQMGPGQMQPGQMPGAR